MQNTTTKEGINMSKQNKKRCKKITMIEFKSEK